MTEAQMTSAAAFVEGGVQDACDDACSICLEDFIENDPATITVCTHEYHLQCILEWSQRSKECPMCWQPLYLKDKDNQLVLAASEQERTLRQQRSSHFYQNSLSFDYTQFHSFPTFDYSDFEDQTLHHLATAGIGRVTRREESLTVRPSPNQDQTNHFHASSSPSSSSVGRFLSAGNLSVQQSGWTSNGHVSKSGVRTAQVTPLESTSSSLMSEPLKRGRRRKEIGSIEGNSSRQQVLVDNVEGQAPPSSPEMTVSESFPSRLVPVRAASPRQRESLARTTGGSKEQLNVRNGTIANGTGACQVTPGVAGPSERVSLERSDKQRENRNNAPRNAPISSRDTDRNSRRVSADPGPSQLPNRMNGAKLPSNTSSSSGDTLGETGRSGVDSASSSSTNTHQRSPAGFSRIVKFCCILSCFGSQP